MIEPLHSRCRPPIDRETVVLPEPDSPTRARHSPGAICRLTSWTTVVPVYAADTSRSVSAASDGGSSRLRSCASGASSRVGDRGTRVVAAHDVVGADELDRRERSHGTRPSPLRNVRRTSSRAAAVPVTEPVPAARRPRDRRSMSGTAAMRWRVYGWAAPANSSAVGPCSTIRPAYITATRSARLATTARSWVTYRAATPWARHSSRTVASTCACVLTSRPVVGSSSTITLGRQANAIASPTRCCWPPDSWCG